MTAAVKPKLPSIWKGGPELKRFGRRPPYTDPSRGA
jgi:hypothetical protein